jgi:hypothetical protein
MRSNAKKITTISLPEKESLLLAEFAKAKSLSKSHVVAHALRVLSTLDDKLSTGSRVYLEDGEKNKTELVIL